MKLVLKSESSGEYVHPLDNKGYFKNVEINESISINRNRKSLEIIFTAVDERGIEVGRVSKIFKGNDEDTNTSYIQAMFHFIEGENQEPQSLTAYAQLNGFPSLADIEFDNWGCPNYQHIGNYFTGGNLSSPEIHPINEIVYAWILENVKINGEKLGVQFKFEI